MKVFRLDDGRILQLADKKKMDHWDAEMPLLFIGDTREKQLPEYKKIYPKAVVQEIEDYLEDILESVAIPKLINALTSKVLETRLKVAENIAKLSESNPDQLKIALPHVEKALQDPNKQIQKLMETTLKNYKRAQKRKETAKKRKILTKLRKQMDIVDNDFADGKINDEQYMIEQKKYLVLKREIELAEQVD
ncbi:hypothetical protein NEF87_001821 [Candidatus Lokiarchaeum ossiferum]|uniref:Uncharacterized protein n=1 Tax=Candidatus Lokiarchaeum ossiferum TaxID=2951803 RepID=A0ABY6HPU0_9ARCH|nr:hypothetical protein NEF87_001821 [Candidatus Lokiarchaeum sp. B-35]